MRDREIARRLHWNRARKTNTEREEWAGFGHQFSGRTRVEFKRGFWVSGLGGVGSGGGAGMGGAERCGRDIPELRLGVTQLETRTGNIWTWGSVPLAGS